jgi:arylsulfatase A-like enzyme
MILRREHYGVPLSEQLWSEAFNVSGISSAILGKYHLGSYRQAYTPSHRGFEYSVGFYGSSLGYYDHIELEGYDWFENGVPMGYPGPSLEEGRYSSDIIVEKLYQYLRDRQTNNKNNQLFLYIPLQIAHQPMEVPPGNYSGSCSSLDPEYPTASYIYNQMMGSMDNTVKEIVDILNEFGYNRQNTLISLLGDNGGYRSFGGNNAPLRGQKGDSYEGGVRVPSFIWGRGVPSNRTYSYPISVIDLIPTLIEGAGWQINKVNDGKSIWAGIQWNEQIRYETIVQLDWCQDCPFDYTCSAPCQCPPKPKEFPNSALSAGYRINNWKLIYKETIPELYDLSYDISETINMAQTHPDIVQQMTARLKIYYDRAVEIAKPPCDPKDNPINGWWLPLDYF